MTCDWPINVWVAQVKFLALFQVLMKCIFVWPGKKKACSTDTLFRELPVSQWFPLKPAVHKQRYPLSVKPVWQVALFLQGFFAHAFYGRKGRWDWSCTVVTCFHPSNWHFPLSAWFSEDISLFLHEISLSLKISVQKSLSLFNFYGKKFQDDTNRIRSRSIGFAVHHFNPYTTQDLRATNGLIWIYIATTLTLTLT